MKKLTGLILAAAFGLTMTTGTPLHAQISPVTVQWTLQQQDPSVFENGVYTDKVRRSKLVTADLLALLSNAYATNFPNGFPFDAKLVLIDYDHFEVQASDGSILVTNTSEFLTYSDTFAVEDYLFHGKENTLTGAQNYLFYYHATIQFNDPANGVSFTFTGNAQERSSKSVADQSGYRTYRDSLLINGTGSGHNGEDFFLVSGKVSAPLVQWSQQDPP
jgi:hypothetical protein